MPSGNDSDQNAPVAQANVQTVKWIHESIPPKLGLLSLTNINAPDAFENLEQESTNVKG